MQQILLSTYQFNFSQVHWVFTFEEELSMMLIDAKEALLSNEDTPDGTYPVLPCRVHHQRTELMCDHHMILDSLKRYGYIIEIKDQIPYFIIRLNQQYFYFHERFIHDEYEKPIELDALTRKACFWHW